jgi:hypothetical protein
MSKVDEYELEVLEAYEKVTSSPSRRRPNLPSFVPQRGQPAVKDRRVNIRLSARDLRDIQVKALEEGMACQTLIASVLPKYVTGCLREQPKKSATGSRRQAPSRKERQA